MHERGLVDLGQALHLAAVFDYELGSRVAATGRPIACIVTVTSL